MIQISQAPEGMTYESAAWSPDGTHIAATAARWLFEDPPVEGTRQVALSEMEGQLDLIRTDSSGSTTIFKTNAFGHGWLNPRWSPDGQRLAFVAHSMVESIEMPAIYIVNADGTGRVEVTQGENTAEVYQQYFGLAWSPDGKHLAYLSNGPWLHSGEQLQRSDDARTRLMIFEPDTLKKIEATVPALPDVSLRDGLYYVDFGNLAWSPDGAYLSFLHEPDRNGCFLIHLLHLADAAITTLRPVCVSYFDSPQWSPDSQWLVFAAEPDGLDGSSAMIATVNVAEALRDPDHIVPHYLTGGSGDDFPKWQP